MARPHVTPPRVPESHHQLHRTSRTLGVRALPRRAECFDASSSAPSAATSSPTTSSPSSAGSASSSTTAGMYEGDHREIGCPRSASHPWGGECRAREANHRCRDRSRPRGSPREWNPAGRTARPRAARDPECRPSTPPSRSPVRRSGTETLIDFLRFTAYRSAWRGNTLHRIALDLLDEHHLAVEPGAALEIDERVHARPARSDQPDRGPSDRARWIAAPRRPRNRWRGCGRLRASCAPCPCPCRCEARRSVRIQPRCSPKSFSSVSMRSVSG